MSASRKLWGARFNGRWIDLINVEIGHDDAEALLGAECLTVSKRDVRQVMARFKRVTGQEATLCLATMSITHTRERKSKPRPKREICL